MKLLELLKNKRILAMVIGGALLVFLVFFAAFSMYFILGNHSEPVNEPVVVEEPPEPPAPPPVVIVEEPEESEEEPEEPEIDESKAPNPLTGELIDIEDTQKRPYAVMINNMSLALPQSGIADADIIYEVLAEGGITRMLAVFQKYGSEKIGPIRSARHYYLDFAFDNDAIYVHHGGSPQGYNSIYNLDIDNLDGMSLDGTAFWRDPERVKIPRMFEHSSYSSSQNIYDTSVEYGYRVERLEDFPYMFEFYDELSEAGAEHEDTLEMRFSASQIGSFTYNEETGLYERSQNGEPHIDAETGEQLAVSNVIVQNAKIYVIAGDSEGRRNVELVSSGKGVLYTAGTSEEITWSKESHKAPTQWKDSKGNPLKLNKGKTWICVMGD